MKIVIEHHNAGAANQRSPIEGRRGILGQAAYDPKRKAHCLTLDLATYREHKRAIIEKKPKYSDLTIDVIEDAPPEPEDDGNAGTSRVDRRLLEFAEEGELPHQTLERLLAEYAAFAVWKPSMGKRPVPSFLAPPKE
jgi:hypothetical protein